MLRPALGVALLAISVSCSSRPPAADPDAGAPVQCAAPLLACSGSCVDVKTSAQHCGECGRACASGESFAGGACYPNACGALTCPATHVCIGGLCVERACFGVQCPMGQACAAGACYATACATAACRSDEVCVEGACLPAACVGVLCPAGTRCEQGVCTLDTCGNGVKDGTESDTDCGGICAACVDGSTCAAPADCVSLSCVSQVCAAPSCTDRIRNGAEGDTDCGGGCPACADGRRCTSSAQCASLVCTTGECRAPTCSDMVKNAAESDTDCGGTCPRCPDGRACAAAGDCSSGLCLASRCVTTQCQDGTKNGTETDVDCGGACAPCLNGKTCSAGADCQSGACSGTTAKTCAAPSCTDLVQNGLETDVDCGGATCLVCGAGKRCAGNSDCSSRACVGGRCAGATCSDGIANGGESDVDCGGQTTCPRCGFDDTCAVGADCASGVCTSLKCTAPPLFSAPTATAVTTMVRGLSVGDVDADGHLDVVVVAGSELIIYWGLGTGAFGMPTALQVTSAGWSPPGAPAIGDFNADGKRDLVVGENLIAYAGSVPYGCRAVIFHGAGARGFLPSVTVEDRTNGFSGCGTTVAVGRYDADGVDDVLFSDAPNNGYGGETRGGALLIGSASAYGALTLQAGLGSWVATADLDGDGKQDAISHHVLSDTLRVSMGSGAGVFTQVSSIPVAPGYGHVSAADFNGDGRLDLLVASYTANSIGVSLSNAQGMYLAPVSLAGARPDGVAVADFDRDGKPDVVGANDGLYFYQGRGDGTFAPAVAYGASVGNTTFLATGDFNEDGKVDVVASTFSALQVFRNTLP